MASWPSTLSRVDYVAEGVVAAFFRKPEGFVYLPGQSVSLALSPATPGASPLRHIFSLASAPYEDELCIVTRMRPNSAFKQSLIQLAEGAELSVNGPYGYLTPPRDGGIPLVLIAGGVGIGPFMGILRHHAHQHSSRPVRLLYSNSQRESTAFLDELQSLAQSRDEFSFIPTVTSRESDSWTGHRGRIGPVLLREALDGLVAPRCYIAGVEKMVDDIGGQLRGIGVPQENIYTESFYGY